MRAIARVLAAVLFLLGLLLLVAFSALVLTGDQGVLAQIELGIWSMSFFLAAIYLRIGELASRRLTRPNTDQTE